MPSLSARATVPVVKVIGKRLAAAETPDKLRDEFARSSRLLMPSRGTTHKEVRLDGLRTVRVSTDTADTSGRAILLFHGGGYVFGSPRRYAGLAGRFAKTAGAPVYIPEYRLAPEHPFPGATEDGLRAYKAMLERYPSENIALAGDSAGGGLCVATLQAARIEGLPMPSSLLLLSPWLDVSGASESMQTNRDSEILILPETFARCARWYAGGKDMTDTVMSPIYGSVAGFPPTLIQVSESEMIYNDSTRFATKAKAEGVDVRLVAEPGMWHVWQLMAPLVSEARQSIAQAGQFLERHFAD
jgi:epsilon-lactone hydrolase